MKKFFKDNTLEHQILSVELTRQFFPDLKEVKDEEIQEKVRWIVLHSYQDLNYSVQIVFQDIASNINNAYWILVFDKNDELLAETSYQSHTIYPPIWNREFGGICYIDFLGIQKSINKMLNTQKWEPMKYDTSPDKKFFYFTKENKEELERLVKEGKPYSIIALFAEVRPDLIEHAKKLFDL